MFSNRGIREKETRYANNQRASVNLNKITNRNKKKEVREAKRTLNQEIRKIRKNANAATTVSSLRQARGNYKKALWLAERATQEDFWGKLFHTIKCKNQRAFWSILNNSTNVRPPPSSLSHNRRSLDFPSGVTLPRNSTGHRRE